MLARASSAVCADARVRERYPALPVIMVSAARSEDAAIERAIGHELDRRAVDRVTIVEREQCLLVSGHQPTEGHRVNASGRFERVLAAEDLLALLDQAYDRRSRERAAHQVS